MWYKKYGDFLLLAGIVLLSSLPLGAPNIPFLFYDRFIIVVCNLFTCFACDWTFRKVFDDRQVGVFCAALYTLSIYRLYLTYGKMDMGATVCMAILPLEIYAVHGILMEEKRKKRWAFCALLSISVIGALQAHIIIGAISAVALMAVFIFFWRKIIRRDVLIDVLCSAAIVVLCNMQCIWRCIQEVKLELGLFPQANGRMIQSKGLYFAQLFFSFFERGSHHDYAENGLMDVEAIGIGMALMLPLYIFLFLCIAYRKTEEKSTLMPVGRTASVLGGVSLLLSLSVFPWTRLQSFHRYLYIIISMLQSPEYFLAIATIALTAVAGVVLLWIRTMRCREAYICYISSIMLLAGMGAVFYLSSLI